MAPVFVLMEDVVLACLRSLVGWSEGDGIFCPGGSISNMYAMNVARYWAFPQVKTQGLWSIPRLAVFTSQEVQITMTGLCLNKHHHSCLLCVSQLISLKLLSNCFAIFLARCGEKYRETVIEVWALDQNQFKVEIWRRKST